MAFDSSNPVSIGDATRAADYDQLFGNTTGLQDGTGARDVVDIVSGATTSAEFHMGEALDEGGWFVSLAAGQFVLAAGGEYLSGSWIARSTSFTSLSMGSTGLIFVFNTGLTDGVGFAPAVRATINTSGFVMTGMFTQHTEISDPAAPAANKGRIYARDTGGKTELVVRFPTGAVQRLAIQP